MPNHIFFSWQSDTHSGTGRNFIQRALDRAVAAIARDTEVDPANRDLAVDTDTANVPGSPPVVETIFSKIDRAAAFVSDMTFVARRADDRRMPNPNVLLEHGWALKSKTWRAVISVMNTAHGHPDEHALPFDLAQFRRPILFDCPDDSDQDVRLAARDDLTQQFIRALRAILDDDVLQAARVPAPPREPHPADVRLLRRVRRLLSEPFVLWLRTHSFGTPFNKRRLDPLYEIVETWRGAAFEFHDPVIQAASAPISELAQALSELTLSRLYGMGTSTDTLWHKTEEDARIGTQPASAKAVADMNRTATDLCDAADVLERVARDRIRVEEDVDGQREAAAGVLHSLWGHVVSNQLPVLVSRPRLTLGVVSLAATEDFDLNPRMVRAARPHFMPDGPAPATHDANDIQWWSYGQTRNVGSANREALWLTRLVRPGAAEYQMTIGFRQDDDRDILVDGRALETNILDTFGRLARLLAAIRLTGPGALSIRIDGLEDVVLCGDRPGPRPIGRNEILFPAIQVDDIGRVTRRELRAAFDSIWLTAGWEDGSPGNG